MVRPLTKDVTPDELLRGFEATVALWEIDRRLYVRPRDDNRYLRGVPCPYCGEDLAQSSSGALYCPDCHTTV